LLSEAEEDEEDILDKAFDVRINSRLWCQAKIEREGDVAVRISKESLDAYYNEHPDAPRPAPQERPSTTRWPRARITATAAGAGWGRCREPDPPRAPGTSAARSTGWSGTGPSLSASAACGGLLRPCALGARRRGRSPPPRARAPPARPPAWRRSRGRARARCAVRAVRRRSRARQRPARSRR